MIKYRAGDIGPAGRTQSPANHQNAHQRGEVLRVKNIRAQGHGRRIKHAGNQTKADRKQVKHPHTFGNGQPQPQAGENQSQDRSYFSPINPIGHHAPQYPGRDYDGCQ